MTSLDQYARAHYELRFENRYLKMKGNAFQDFFSSVMEKAHPADFIRVRPWGRDGDRKNDGYLRSERTLFQVYAPNEMTAKNALDKIHEDFHGALPHWEKFFDTWVFVHNAHNGLSPQITLKLLNLDNTPGPRVDHWGFEELRQKTFELNEAGLASLFGPAPTRRDMLDLALAELTPVLDQLALMPATAEPDLRPPPANKIERNSLSQNVETLLIAGMLKADLVGQYFRDRQSNQDELAESFRDQYQALRNEGRSPDEIFAELQRYAGGDSVPTPARQCAVLAVLAFFFEECDIFERDEPTRGPQ